MMLNLKIYFFNELSQNSMFNSFHVGKNKESQLFSDYFVFRKRYFLSIFLFDSSKIIMFQTNKSRSLCVKYKIFILNHSKLT